MARFMKSKSKGKSRKKKPRMNEQAKCRFCREKISEVDYKDIPGLIKLTTPQGKLFSRKRSGNCASHQRSTIKALKQSRFIGLMPYLG